MSEAAKKKVYSAGEQITLSEAIDWTKEYQAHHKGETIAVRYDAQVFTDLLDQTDCTGIRIYNATLDNGKNSFVLVGVNALGQDLTSGLLFEMGAVCPSSCDTGSLLLQPTKGHSHQHNPK